MEELVKYLKALVYLQAQQVGMQDMAVKPEVLLAKAGLSYREVAEVLGKSEMAVAKAVNRAKNSPKKED